MRNRSFLFSIFLLGWFFSSAINFSRVNISWQYDVNFGVRMSHRVVDHQVGTAVFVKVVSDSLNAWEYELLLQKGYESEEHTTLIPVSIDTLMKTAKQFLVKLLLPKTDDNLLVVKFSKPERFYYYDISLKIGNLSFPAIYPVSADGLPIVENYVNRTEHMWEGGDTLLASRYEEKFPPADPPMADMKPLAPQVSVDTAFNFVGLADMEENYFYMMREDSLASTGVTVLRVPPYYPKFRQLTELVESMLYLTSEQEKKAMFRSKNPKESFDSFWMNTFSTKSRARNAIRKYYNWIESSNILFTDFKPGWKTDRGMMYIAFGKPDEVYRTGNLEEWYYDDGSAFEFTIISTFFAAKTYTLRRNREFEEIWYTQIAAIRQGIR